MKNSTSAWLAIGAFLLVIVTVSMTVYSGRVTGAEALQSGQPQVGTGSLVLPTQAQVTAAVAKAATVTALPAPTTVLSSNGFGCMVADAATRTTPCVYGDPHGSHTLVLYGDSQAADWIAAFDTIGKYLHWKVYELTKAGCHVPDLLYWDSVTRKPYTECQAFHSFALPLIVQLHPDVVVLASKERDAQIVVKGHPTQQGIEDAWETGLAKVIDTLKPASGKVVVLGEFAFGSPAGTACVAAHEQDLQACNLPRSSAIDDTHNHMEQSTARQHGALYVNTVPWFCTTTVCPAVVSGIITRADASHLAPSYALWLSDVLAAAIGLLPAAQHG